jgi:hypothetical protein
MDAGTKRASSPGFHGPSGMRRDHRDEQHQQHRSERSDARKKKSANVLESVQEEATKRAERLRDDHYHQSHNRHGHANKKTEDVLVRRVKEMSEEDARELAFQATEQMRTLKEVSSRVKTALTKAQDLDVDSAHHHAGSADNKSVDARKWLSESRRHINGAIFRYNESCEERNEALSGFCNWFELYENIWPLPLVSNDLQYDVLLGKDGKLNQDHAQEHEAVHEIWPQVSKMREDLSQIMSVTSEMGQKALNADLRAQMNDLRAKISEKAAEVEAVEKKLRAEKDINKQREQEMIKLRQMNEVQVKRRFVCVFYSSSCICVCLCAWVHVRICCLCLCCVLLYILCVQAVCGECACV